MKNKLMYRLCLMMVVVLSIYSCRTDQFPEKETYNNISAFQLTSKRISLNESKHKAKLLSEIEKAETEFKKIRTNVFGKTVNYGNGVSIDTDDMIYIENGTNYHTYTFNITRKNAPADAPLENLLLIPLPDGKYKEYLVVYNLSASEKEKISAGLLVDTKGKTEITELVTGTYNGSGQLARLYCFNISQSFWSSCSGKDHHDGSNYQDCPIYNGTQTGTPPMMYTIITNQCIEENDDIITPIDPGGNSGGGGGPGGIYTPPAGSNPPCTGITIPTNPQPGFTDENGCPIGAPTLPNNPIRNNPCEKLKNLLDPAKANVKPLIINGMYDHINNNPSGEGGINLKSDANGNLSSEPSPYTNTNMANIKAGGTYYAGIHSHPKDTYPMFSWSDIYVLYKLEMNIATYNNRKSSLLLVCEDANGVKQTYAIVFENIGSMMEVILNDPQYAWCTPKEICDKMDLKLQEKYDEEAKKANPDYERVFLQFNFGTNIGMYKANPDLTNWSKLSISTNSDTATVTPNNCN